MTASSSSMAVEDATYLACYYGGVGGGNEGHGGIPNPRQDHCHDSPQIEDKNDDDKSRKTLDEIISPGSSASLTETSGYFSPTQSAEYSQLSQAEELD
eukprot:8778922-Ditylum_brightwellii.AAC.1